MDSLDYSRVQMPTRTVPVMPMAVVPDRIEELESQLATERASAAVVMRELCMHADAAVFFRQKAAEARVLLNAERAISQQLETALRKLVSFDDVRHVVDDGPLGEGWQSNALSKAVAESDRALAAARGHQGE